MNQHEDMKASLAADVMELWKNGRQGAYRIALDLPWSRIEALLGQARERLDGRPEALVTGRGR